MYCFIPNMYVYMTSLLPNCHPYMVADHDKSLEGFEGDEKVDSQWVA